MRIGVMTGWGGDRANPFDHVAEFGLSCCQLCNWDPAQWEARDPTATRAQADAAGTGMSIDLGRAGRDRVDHRILLRTTFEISSIARTTTTKAMTTIAALRYCRLL